MRLAAALSTVAAPGGRGPLQGASAYGGIFKCQLRGGRTSLLPLLLSSGAGKSDQCLGVRAFSYLHLNLIRQQNRERARGTAAWLVAPSSLQYQAFIYPLTVFSDSIMLVGFECR